jgi:hypothetical protein
MKPFMTLISILLILAGGTFFLQGINLLPGSFMTGDARWVVNGAIMFVVGLGPILWVNRRK